MKTLLFVLPLLLLMGPLNAAEIDWENDLKSLLVKAKKQDKLIMIDLYTDWCGYCKKLDRETYVDDEVVKLSLKFFCIKINPEKDSQSRLDFISGLNYTGFPTIFFVNYQKEVYGKVNGYKPGKDFAEVMSNVLKNKPNLKNARAQHKKGKLDATVSLIDMLIENGINDEAISLILALKKKNKLPAKPGFYFTLGYDYLGNRKFKEAYETFNAITKMVKEKNGEYYQALEVSLYSLYMSGKKDEAREKIQKEIDKKTPYSEDFIDLQEFLKRYP
ncbi:MAG: thioredoxin family protein [Spirochaetales bacterium]|nr:thioredoxin family protein [Spirochaetales bacterium]